MQNYDVIVIGAGHNGLTCAAYLGRAGLRVKVVERRAVVGGAAVTAEFYPGFRNSVAAYTVSLLNPKVIADLALARHGLKIVERRAQNFVPAPDGRYLLAADGRMPQELAKFSARDAERYAAFNREIDAVADVLRRLVLSRRRTWSRAFRGAASAKFSARSASPTACAICRWKRAARSSTSSPNRPRIIWTAGSRANSSKLVRLRRRGRQLREPLHARHRLRDAAPRLRRGERQEAACGATPSAAWARSRTALAERRPRARRRDRDRAPACAKSSSSATASPASCSTTAARCAPTPSPRTSIRSFSTRS